MITRAITGKELKRSYDSHYMLVGRTAEEIVIEFLEKRKNIVEVIDLHNDPLMQESEIDIEIIFSDGERITSEIKSDYHLGVSGNILFEVLRINHTSDPLHALKLGWAGRTTAEEILYYAPQVNKIYRTKTCDLRKAFQRYTYDYRKRTFINYVETDEIKSTINILIPFDEYCKDIFRIYEVR